MKTRLKVALAGLPLFFCLLLPSHPAFAVGYTLTVGAVGSGMVTPDNTNNPHPPGVNITITATPNAGWYFANWSGDASGNVNPLQVTMNSNLAITGNFVAYPTYMLTLATNGQGDISLTPPGGSYYSNTTVTATAAPASGWVFAGWSGATNSSANPVAITVNTNISLSGTFAQLPVFDVQPASITNQVGSTASFTSHANGTAPLKYQWYFSGGSIPTIATNATLSLTNVNNGQAGNYWVVATNNYGSATSQVASLVITNAAGPTNLVNSANEASLRAAIAAGGWISLHFNGPLTLTSTINITNNVILDGTGFNPVISGGNAVRIFYVANSGNLTASNIVLANGCCLVTNGAMADAGAVYNDGGIVALFSCTITNNSAKALVRNASARGGAIFNKGGTVLLTASAISENAAIAQGEPYFSGFGGYNIAALGGAIFNATGAINVIGCTINSNLCSTLLQLQTDNSASGLSAGGAIYMGGGTVSLANSVVRDNSAQGLPGSPNHGGGGGGSAFGGGISVSAGDLSVDHCQFLGNHAIGGNAGYHTFAGVAYGGAIYCLGTVIASDSTFSQNQTVTGAGSFNGAVSSYVGPSGYGGGICNNGKIKVKRCTISSNQVIGGLAFAYINSYATSGSGLGGGIYNAGQIWATNSTIALNIAQGGPGTYGALPPAFSTNGSALGGGLYNDSSATFTGINLSIASNICNFPATGYPSSLAAGFQVGNTNTGIVHVHNSLIAFSGTNTAVFGTIIDDGFNICSDASASLNSGTSYNNTDPKLGPFADNGGPTWTMNLLPDSPAIDFGDSAGLPPTDQRGFLRPFGDGPDIGAVEYGASVSAFPDLSFNLSSGSVLMSFYASPGNVYHLQSSTNLATWDNITTNGPYGASTNIVTMLGKSQTGCWFFRLQMQ